uniref:Pentatricopeptide repeat-containing protein n=1 Tax=Manihot esculenta TaxID=3983 RepID=A0A199UAJ0_MANES
MHFLLLSLPLYQLAQSLPFPILYFLSSFPISDPSLKATDERSMMMKMPWEEEEQELPSSATRGNWVHFNRFLSALLKMNQYHTVFSMSKTIELLGISHDVYSLSILINCFCHLHLVDFGFSVFGKMLKFGLEPDVVTFTTLINGLCIENKMDKAELREYLHS